MTKKTIPAQIEQLLDDLDSQEDLSEVTKLLHKRFFEKSLNAELDDHLGYEKYSTSGNPNSRNGVMRKTVYTDDGALEIETPRDRDASFEPQIIQKR